MGILPPVLLASHSNRLVITSLLLHQEGATTLLLRKLASAGICEEATRGKVVGGSARSLTGILVSPQPSQIAVSPLARSLRNHRERAAGWRTGWRPTSTSSRCD